jgi:hypothetical protein
MLCPPVRSSLCGVCHCVWCRYADLPWTVQGLLRRLLLPPWVLSIAISIALLVETAMCLALAMLSVRALRMLCERAPSPHEGTGAATSAHTRDGCVRMPCVLARGVTASSRVT